MFDDKRETTSNVSVKGKTPSSVNRKKLKSLLDNLKKGILKDESILFLNNNPEDKEVFSNKLLEAAREGLADCLGVGMGTIEGAESFIKKVTDTFNIKNEALCSDDVLEAVRERVAVCLEYCKVDDANKLIQFVNDIFGVESKDLCSDKYFLDKVREAEKEGLAYCLQWRQVGEAEQLIQFVNDNFGIDGKDLCSDKVLETVKRGLAYYLYQGKILYAKDLIQFVKTELGINSERLYSTEIVKSGCELLTSYVQQKNIPAQALYKENAQELFTLMKDEFGDKIKITEEHLELIKEKNYLDLYSIQKALEDGVDLNDKKKIWKDYLLKYGKYWQDKEQILNPFKKGVKYFGLDFMFEYIDENNVSLHDKMVDFRDICKLCDKFGNTPEIRRKFYCNILKQVKDDGSQYDDDNVDEWREKTSYHHLNAIARNLKNDFIDDILSNAKIIQETFPDIESLVSHFRDRNKIIASWKDLKKFMRLKSFVDEKDKLEELAKIKENNEKIYEYAKALLFHKNSNVDIRAVKEFLYKPKKFFRRGNAYSDGETHQKIKPSNFFEHGLSAKDLQQAIVSGALDEVQEIRPMMIEYEVRERTVLEYLEYAIGNRAKKGQVSNRGDLVEELFKTFDEKRKNTNLNLFNYADIKLDEQISKKLENRKIIKQGKELTNEEKIANRKKRILLDKIQNGEIKLNKEQEEKIMEVLKTDTEMQKIFRDEISVYRAQIHRKSDPMATLVGDDTACCMPFGSGKGNIYFFTPNNAIFSLQRMIDEEFRTIAQSVMTLDANTTDVKAKDIHDISEVPQKTFKNKLVLTCDNVEVAPNYQDEKNIKIIEELYRCFYRSYLKENPERVDVEKNPVEEVAVGRNAAEESAAEESAVEENWIIIGKGYSDALTNLKEIDNTFIPTSLLGYSDNTRDKSYVLNLDQEEGAKLHFSETGRGVSDKHKSEKSGEYTIENIRLSDILKIAKLENDVYGESLKEGMAEVQNTITSYLILNALQQKQDGFAFKMLDKEGALSSYMIATEKTIGDKKEIYIADFASRNNKLFSNGRMICTFFKRYMKQYGESGDFPAITAEFREETSYKFIEDEKKLNKFLSRYGLKAKVVETGIRENGDEKFHNCSIYIIKSDAEKPNTDELSDEEKLKFDELIEAYKKAREEDNNKDYDDAEEDLDEDNDEDYNDYDDEDYDNDYNDDYNDEDYDNDEDDYDDNYNDDYDDDYDDDDYDNDDYDEDDDDENYDDDYDEDDDEEDEGW